MKVESTIWNNSDICSAVNLEVYFFIVDKNGRHPRRFRAAAFDFMQVYQFSKEKGFRIFFSGDFEQFAGF